VNARVLVVEDHEQTRRRICESLDGAGYLVCSAANGREALSEIERSAPDAVVCDYRMSPVDGLELLRAVRRSLDVPFILYSAGADADAIFRAGRDGAFVFLEYPFRIEDQLVPTIEASLAQRSSIRTRRTGIARLAGSSAAMQRVRSLIRRVAPSRASVLIVGDTGTGKELVARAIHDESGRGPLVSVSVTELPETLLESELFGHARGAFTGAVTNRDGLFVRAHGGTLFLDEIGDAPLSLQAKILRSLETGEVRRVGDGGARRVDVRLLAATHRDLRESIQAGRFREDLYYRIREVEVHLAPLRERLEDLEALSEDLLGRCAREMCFPTPRVTRDFLTGLRNHLWPGNVRELRTLLQNVLLWWDGSSELRRADLVEAFAMLHPGLPVNDFAERNLMIEAFRRCGGNQEAARRELGLSRGEWRYRWSRYGLDVLGRRRG
jgi:DNA-binding NtrC family response regulator